MTTLPLFRPLFCLMPFAAAAVVAFASAPAAEPPADAEWKSLGNGKDLDGWDGDPRLWRVEDGVLIGETDGGARKPAGNTFLIWRGGEPADFELEFKARFSGDNNSGVQYRSRVVDAKRWVVAGYQFDLHPAPNYLGMLYEEKGRGIIAENGRKVELAPGPKVVAEFPRVEAQASEWNDYRIVARGEVLQHFINGRLAAEVRDLDKSKRALRGVVALQLHAGLPMKVEFKDLRLRVLPPQTPAAPGEPAADQRLPGVVP